MRESHCLIDGMQQRRGSRKNSKSYHNTTNRTVESGQPASTSTSKSISMSDNDSRKSSTGVASESSSRASSPINNSRGGGDVDDGNDNDNDNDNRSINSEVDYKDVEIAPLIPTEESGLQVDPHKDMTTSEWISFILKKNGKVLSTCLSYSFCSVSMVLVNKSLASSYNHLIDGDLNILLVVIQAIVAVFAVEGCKRLGWVEYPSFSFETAKEWAPVNIFFCLMLFTGMSSLQYNSVPMVTIFKNISNITTAVGDYYCFGNKPEPLVVVAFGIMLSGAVAAASNDLTLSPIGILWMVGNCISSSGYVLYMKHATEKVQLSKFGMVFYNNVLCVVFLLPVAIAMGQTKIFFTTPAIHTPDYAMKNLFAGMVGFLLNFASLSCVATSGPTTYVTIGSLNKIPVAILGYYIFDSIISQETWFCIAFSMCGGFLYSYAKLKSSSSPRTNRTK